MRREGSLWAPCLVLQGCNKMRSPRLQSCNLASRTRRSDHWISRSAADVDHIPCITDPRELCPAQPSHTAPHSTQCRAHSVRLTPPPHLTSRSTSTGMGLTLTAQLAGHCGSPEHSSASVSAVPLPLPAPACPPGLCSPAPPPASAPSVPAAPAAPAGPDFEVRGGAGAAAAAAAMALWPPGRLNR